MVMVVHDTPDNASFTAALFGEPQRGLVEYIGYRYDQASQYLSDRARQWMSEARGMFQKADYEDLLRTTRAMRRNIEGAFRDDVIRPMWGIGEFQTAGPVMQRWIMASPDVRELYHQNGCDGYSGSYYDRYPGVVGEGHYDYRRVMDGVVVIQDDGAWHADSYIETLADNDRDLLPDEQHDILSSVWKQAKRFIVAGEDDPTSKWNGSL